MTRIEVRSQVELDAALEGYRNDPDALIIILSDPGVWLYVDDTGSATVEAGGSATVEAWDRATVEAWDRATVEAGGSATVRAAKYVAVHLHSQQVTLSGGSSPHKRRYFHQ